MPRPTRRYYNRLEEYLRWIPQGSDFLSVPVEVAVPGGVSAAEAMCSEESTGRDLPCAEPGLLAQYRQGKRLRDWHITEWRAGVGAGLFWPFEFIGTLGCDEHNAGSIFGRSVGL